MSGNGAALFEMFSYLILCPSTGPSLIRLAWPRVPTVPCSTAYLVQLMTPGAACYPAFTLTSFSSSLLMLLLLKPAQFPCPWLLSSFSWVVVLFPLVLLRDPEKNFLVGSSVRIKMGREHNFLCIKGSVTPKHFPIGTALLDAFLLCLIS